MLFLSLMLIIFCKGITSAKSTICMQMDMMPFVGTAIRRTLEAIGSQPVMAFGICTIQPI